MKFYEIYIVSFLFKIIIDLFNKRHKFERKKKIVKSFPAGEVGKAFGELVGEVLIHAILFSRKLL